MLSGLVTSMDVNDPSMAHKVDAHASIQAAPSGRPAPGKAAYVATPLRRAVRDTRFASDDIPDVTELADVLVSDDEDWLEHEVSPQGVALGVH